MATDNTKAALLFPTPKDPTKIGQIEVDVMVSSELTYSSDVTENPVEDGFPVHDHVVCQPIRLSMVVLVSPLPVTWYEKFGVDVGRIDDTVSKLEQIYKERQPITIITNEKTYENMVMTECKISKNKEDGKALKVPLEFLQIRKVEVKTADIPEEYVDSLTAGQAGATEQDAGTVETTTVDDTSTADDSSGGSQSTGTKSKSILKGVFS